MRLILILYQTDGVEFSGLGESKDENGICKDIDWPVELPELFMEWLEGELLSCCCDHKWRSSESEGGHVHGKVR